MYFEPTHFKPEGIFSQLIFNREKHKGNQIWRLMDRRILWTADQLRERFGKMTINDWLWGGLYHLRGYRDIFVDIIESGEDFSLTSQHCFGRAIDYNFEDVTAEEVIQDILSDPWKPEYKYITGLETGTTWVHNDTRSWDKGANGLFTFGKKEEAE